MLVNTDAREATDEGGRVAVRDLLVVSEGVVPDLLTVGGLRPGMTSAVQLEMSQIPPACSFKYVWLRFQ